MALGDERQDPYPSGVSVSVPMDTSEDEGKWDLANMLQGPSTVHEQRGIVLRNIRSLVNRVGLLASSNGKCLATCRLRIERPPYVDGAALAVNQRPA